MIQVKKQL